MASITQLEYLIAVDRYRHFGKAAKACHVSQPTLSMQLQKLEDEYGVTFFDRGKQPILPTPEGEAIIQQARTILREFGKLEFLCKARHSEPMGEFRLALIPTVAPYLLPVFLGEFASAYPAVKLLIEEMTTENLIQALEDDRIDAGILATPLHVESLVEIPLYYEPFCLYVSAHHPLNKVTQVDADLLDEKGYKDIWLLAEGHCLRNQILRVCSLRGKSGIFQNVRFESGSLETVMHLVEQGHGYTLLPDLATRTLPRHRKEMLRPFARPVPSREVSLVCRRTQYKKPILEALKREIQKKLPSDLPRVKSREIEVVRI